MRLRESFARRLRPAKQRSGQFGSKRPASCKSRRAQFLAPASSRNDRSRVNSFRLLVALSERRRSRCLLNTCFYADLDVGLPGPSIRVFLITTARDRNRLVRKFEFVLIRVSFGPLFKFKPCQLMVVMPKGIKDCLASSCSAISANAVQPSSAAHCGIGRRETLRASTQIAYTRAHCLLDCCHWVVSHCTTAPRFICRCPSRPQKQKLRGRSETS